MNLQQPDEFVQGVIVDNTPSHVYEGKVLTRRVTIKTKRDEQTLTVLDDGVTLVFATISDHLILGHEYSFLIALFVHGVQRLRQSERPPTLKIVPSPTPGPATWIVTRDGKAPVCPYTVAVPRLDELDWAIVQTAVGLMVVNPDEFDPTTMHDDDAIRWRTLKRHALSYIISALLVVGAHPMGAVPDARIGIRAYHLPAMFLHAVARML